MVICFPRCYMPAASDLYCCRRRPASGDASAADAPTTSTAVKGAYSAWREEHGVHASKTDGADGVHTSTTSDGDGVHAEPLTAQDLLPSMLQPLMARDYVSSNLPVKQAAGTVSKHVHFGYILPGRSKYFGVLFWYMVSLCSFGLR